MKTRNADLEGELRSDLELEEEEQRERGLSPDEARYAARRIGSPTTVQRPVALSHRHTLTGMRPFTTSLAVFFLGIVQMSAMSATMACTVPFFPKSIFRPRSSLRQEMRSWFALPAIQLRWFMPST